MKTMKALRLKTFGSPTVLSLEDVGIPDLKPGHALVEIHASAINPSDVKNVAGLFKATLPQTPGRDYSGVVIAGSTAWKGKHVWGSGAGFGMVRDGAHAQFLLVEETWLSEKPSGLSMEEAAAIGAPYVAAWATLVDAANLLSGETLLITGASGAVGRAAAQIAKWKGARVIGADIAGDGNGLDAFINVNEQDLAATVKAVTNGKGVNVVLDTVAGALFQSVLNSLALDGRQIAISSVGTRRVEFDLIDFYRNRNRLIGVDTSKLTGIDIAKIMNELRVGFEEGRFRAPTTRSWPLDQAIDAYTAVERGEAAVKHLLTPRVQ